MKFLLSIFLLFVSFSAFADTLEQYEKGQGAFLNGDYVTAWKTLKPLADQGQGNSQVNIGEMYWYGAGVQKNFMRAYMWFTLAENTLGPHNDDGAASSAYKTELSEKMSSEQIEKAEQMAKNWKPIAKVQTKKQQK